MMSALDLQHYHNLLIEEGGRKRACRCAANWLEIWVLVREVSTIDKCNQPKAQRMEIKIIKQVLKKKKKKKKIRGRNLLTKVFPGILTRVHSTGPLQCQNMLLVVIAREKIIGRGKNHIPPSLSLQIMVGGRERILAFFRTSPSLCRLTAHHKSISTWRKSISRLLSFPSKKNKKRKLPELQWGGKE